MPGLTSIPMTRLRVAFVKGGDGEMPTTLAVTDEHMEDEHNGIPPYYLDALDAEKLSGGGEFIREAFVMVPQGAILALFGADGSGHHLNARPPSMASVRLRVFFVAYEDTAKTMPNAMVVCDEHIEDAHGTEFPEFYVTACAKALAEGGPDARGAHGFVYVSERAVLALFETPLLAGSVRVATAPVPAAALS